MSKQNSNVKPKEKYEQKDSLYIDVGQALLNGKTDTLTNSITSNNNSLLISQSPMNSNPNSLSKFAKGGKAGGNDLRKLAILKNTAANSHDSDTESSPQMIGRSNSEGVGQLCLFKQEKSDESTEDISNEDPNIEKNIKQLADGNTKVHPSKLAFPGKRYSLLENRSAGNSPRFGNQNATNMLSSRFNGETKPVK